MITPELKILILLIILFDVIGAHLYSKMVMLILIIVIINDLDLIKSRAYTPIELNNDFEL